MSTRSLLLLLGLQLPVVRLFLFRPLVGGPRSPLLPSAPLRSATASLSLTAGPTILTCGRCKAAYEIDMDGFGSGQQVRCENCGHEWFQSAARLMPMPPDMELIEYPQAMRDRMAAGKPAEAISRYRCFVGNLAFTVAEDELRELFEPYGSVVGVIIMADETGRPKGFGFVNMESAVAGSKAVEELNGVDLHGRQINVSEGKQSVSRGRGRGDGRGRGRGRGDGGRGRGGRGGRGDGGGGGAY